MLRGERGKVSARKRERDRRFLPLSDSRNGSTIKEEGTGAGVLPSGSCLPPGRRAGRWTRESCCCRFSLARTYLRIASAFAARVRTVSRCILAVGIPIYMFANESGIIRPHHLADALLGPSLLTLSHARILDLCRMVAERRKRRAHRGKRRRL